MRGANEQWHGQRLSSPLAHLAQARRPFFGTCLPTWQAHRASVRLQQTGVAMAIGISLQGRNLASAC